MRLLCGSIIKTPVYRQEWQEDGREADSLDALRITSKLAPCRYGFNCKRVLQHDKKKIKMDARVHALHTLKQPLNPHPLTQKRVVWQREGNTKATSEGSREESLRGGADKKSEMLDVRSLRRIDEGFGGKKGKKKRSCWKSEHYTRFCQHCLLETSLTFREMWCADLHIYCVSSGRIVFSPSRPGVFNFFEDPLSRWWTEQGAPTFLLYKLSPQ